MSCFRSLPFSLLTILLFLSLTFVALSSEEEGEEPHFLTSGKRISRVVLKKLILFLFGIRIFLEYFFQGHLVNRTMDWWVLGEQGDFLMKTSLQVMNLHSIHPLYWLLRGLTEKIL